MRWIVYVEESFWYLRKRGREIRELAFLPSLLSWVFSFFGELLPPGWLLVEDWGRYQPKYRLWETLGVGLASMF